MWPLADGNSAILKRSHAIEPNFIEKFTYEEYRTFPNFISAFNFYMYIFRAGTFLGNSWFADLFYKYCLT
jgi:hypothetical protein